MIDPAIKVAVDKTLKHLISKGWYLEDKEVDRLPKIFSKHGPNDLVDIVQNMLKCGLYFCNIEDVLEIEEARKIYKQTLKRETEKIAKRKKLKNPWDDEVEA